MVQSRAQVVVITGASAGVGRALARLYAQHGAAIGLIARGHEGLAATAREVVRLGGTALPLALDVSDADSVERAATAVEERLGPIELWINNAMVSVLAPVAEMQAAEFRRVMEVCYLGTVHGTLAALRRMRTRGEGTILQVGSALAYRGLPLQSAYCAAKHAIQGFQDSLRCELLHERSRVRVTMVQLPAVNTPHFGWARSRMPFLPQPVPPIYQPEVAARAIRWSASHPGRERLVGWSTVKAVIGNALAPGLADRVLARMGYGVQQTAVAVDPERADNLWFPLPGDQGAHGAFDARARESSLQWFLVRHRAAILTLGISATVAALRRWRARRRAPADAPPTSHGRRLRIVIPSSRQTHGLTSGR